MIFCTRLLNVQCSPQLNLPAYNQYAIVVSLKEIYIFIYLFIIIQEIRQHGRHKSVNQLLQNAPMLEIYSFGTRSSWCTLLLPWAVTISCNFLFPIKNPSQCTSVTFHRNMKREKMLAANGLLVNPK